MSTLTMPIHSTFWLSIKRWITQHPFLAYFLLAFGGTWLLDLPLILGKDGLGLLPYHMPFVAYAAIFLSGSYAGPTLAAFAVTAIWEGRAGVRHFWRRYGQWRVGLRWYLLILVGYPLFFLGLVSLGLGGVSLSGLRQHWSTLFNPSCDRQKVRIVRNHLSKAVDTGSQNKQDDLQLKTFGGDGMNGFG